MSADLTDEELREQLAARGIKDIAITPQTRRLYLRKLRKLLGESEQLENSSVQKYNAESPLPPLPTLPISSSPEGFYVLIHENNVPECITVSRSDAVKAAKSQKGTRFRRFATREEANTHILSLQANDQELKKQNETHELSGIEKAKIVEKEFNPLSKIKTEEKNRMRALMENKEHAQFIEQVWKNPKYLVSSGDCPEIYHEGMRRNILHCAVDKGNLEFCQELFKTIQSDQFWETLYPHDSSDKREADRCQLVDKYLNMQDGTVKMESTAKRTPIVAFNNSRKEEESKDYIKVKTLETPLHIASKKGDEKMVRFLMSFPAIDTSIRNYDGETAADVACKRMSTPNAKLKQRILELISSPPIYYVPVYRSPDVSLLGDVCVLNQSPIEKGPPIVCEDGIGQAFAGPLSPAEANEFHKHWKSPLTKEERRKAQSIRRSDPDRGLERIGRNLAHSQSIGWMEYWEFLSGYYDLSKPDGLDKLELYLSKKSLSATESAHLSADNSSYKESLTDSAAITKSVSRLNKSESTRKALFPSKGNDDSPLIEDSEDPLEGATKSVMPTLMGKLSLGEENITRTNEGGRLKQGTSAGGRSEQQENTSVASSHTDNDEAIEITKIHGNTKDHETLSPASNLITTPPCGTSSTPPPTIPTCFATPLRNIPNRIFIFGDQPTKLDKDVYLAMNNVPIDSSTYPNISRWRKLIESYKEDESKFWPTPKSHDKLEVSHHHDNHQPSPLLLSSPLLPSSVHSPLASHMTYATGSGSRSRNQATPTWRSATRSLNSNSPAHL